MPSTDGSIPETTLVQRTIAGDGAALDTLIARHLPSVRAFVRLRMGPLLQAREEADDIVQSVCRELLMELDRFDYRGETRFRNWLYVAVLNKLRDHRKYYLAEKRDMRREKGATDGDDESWFGPYSSVATPSQRAMAREHAELVERAFERLPDQYREVLTLSRIVGLTHAEIAEETGRTEGSVRNLMTRALVKLAALLEESGAG